MISTGNKQIKEITGLTRRKGGGEGGWRSYIAFQYLLERARYKATLQPGWIVVYFVLGGHTGPGLRKLSIIAPAPWLQRWLLSYITRVNRKFFRLHYSPANDNRCPELARSRGQSRKFTEYFVTRILSATHSKTTGPTAPGYTGSSYFVGYFGAVINYL